LLDAEEVPLQAGRVGYATELLATFQVLLGLGITAQAAGGSAGQKPSGGIAGPALEVAIQVRSGRREVVSPEVGVGLPPLLPPALVLPEPAAGDQQPTEGQQEQGPQPAVPARC